MGPFSSAVTQKISGEKKGKNGQWLEEERFAAGKKNTARLGKLFPTGELWVKVEK